MDGNILFSGPMIRAILEGRKTQTRRLATSPLAKRKPGDKLWIRERTMVDRVEGNKLWGTYVADGAPTGEVIIPLRIKRPTAGFCMSMGCFKGAHRLEIALKRVWIEPLQAISEEDCIAEGADKAPMVMGNDYLSPPESFKAGYRALWDSLHSVPKDSWDANPDVVALEFERIA